MADGKGDVGRTTTTPVTRHKLLNPPFLLSSYPPTPPLSSPSPSVSPAHRVRQKSTIQPVVAPTLPPSVTPKSRPMVKSPKDPKLDPDLEREFPGIRFVPSPGSNFTPNPRVEKIVIDSAELLAPESPPWPKGFEFEPTRVYDVNFPPYTPTPRPELIEDRTALWDDAGFVLPPPTNTPGAARKPHIPDVIVSAVKQAFVISAKIELVSRLEEARAEVEFQDELTEVNTDRQTKGLSRLPTVKAMREHQRAEKTARKYAMLREMHEAKKKEAEELGVPFKPLLAEPDDEIDSSDGEGFDDDDADDEGVRLSTPRAPRKRVRRPKQKRRPYQHLLDQIPDISSVISPDKKKPMKKHTLPVPIDQYVPYESDLDTSYDTEIEDDPPRPTNKFILYRSIFCRRSETLNVKSSVQKMFSTSISWCWAQSPTEVQDYHAWLASMAKELHSLKYPGYVYRPNTTKRKEKRELRRKLRMERRRARREAFGKQWPPPGGIKAYLASLGTVVGKKRSAKADASDVDQRPSGTKRARVAVRRASDRSTSSRPPNSGDSSTQRVPPARTYAAFDNGYKYYPKSAFGHADESTEHTGKSAPQEPNWQDLDLVQYEDIVPEPVEQPTLQGLGLPMTVAAYPNGDTTSTPMIFTAANPMYQPPPFPISGHMPSHQSHAYPLSPPDSYTSANATPRIDPASSSNSFQGPSAPLMPSIVQPADGFARQSWPSLEAGVAWGDSVSFDASAFSFDDMGIGMDIDGVSNDYTRWKAPEKPKELQVSLPPSATGRQDSSTSRVADRLLDALTLDGAATISGSNGQGTISPSLMHSPPGGQATGPSSAPHGVEPKHVPIQVEMSGENMATLIQRMTAASNAKGQVRLVVPTPEPVSNTGNYWTELMNGGLGGPPDYMDDSMFQSHGFGHQDHSFDSKMQEANDMENAFVAVSHIEDVSAMNYLQPPLMPVLWNEQPVETCGVNGFVPLHSYCKDPQDEDITDDADRSFGSMLNFPLSADEQRRASISMPAPPANDACGDHPKSSHREPYVPPTGAAKYNTRRVGGNWRPQAVARSNRSVSIQSAISVRSGVSGPAYSENHTIVDTPHFGTYKQTRFSPGTVDFNFNGANQNSEYTASPVSSIPTPTFMAGSRSVSIDSNNGAGGPPPIPISSRPPSGYQSRSPSVNGFRSVSGRRSVSGSTAGMFVKPPPRMIQPIRISGGTSRA
ncbi:hypothetical protein FRB99_000728 [Tulasnella sp. 403]|nr:hypothetical protein FRB99_000728 [Tulasnella sp. 403]